MRSKENCFHISGGINMEKYYIGNITPAEDTIFVFGSNPEGRHGAVRAYFAGKQFGAKYGQGEGLQGSAYALPTTELRFDTGQKTRHSLAPETIIGNIKRMYKCAKSMPDKKFKVAYRSMPNEVTLCGYSGKELMEMFNQAGECPDNVIFSKEWLDSGILNCSK